MNFNVEPTPHMADGTMALATQQCNEAQAHPELQQRHSQEKKGYIKKKRGAEEAEAKKSSSAKSRSRTTAESISPKDSALAAQTAMSGESKA